MHHNDFFAYLKSFLLKLTYNMITMQKYNQLKNQALLNFLENNQVCVLKKDSKKYDGNLDRKNRLQQTSKKKEHVIIKSEIITYKKREFDNSEI